MIRPIAIMLRQAEMVLPMAEVGRRPPALEPFETTRSPIQLPKIESTTDQSDPVPEGRHGFDEREVKRRHPSCA